MVIRTSSQSWMSSTASKRCLKLNFVLHTPVWLTLTCCRRATFSCSDSHLAFMGVSGIKSRVRTPTTMVRHPITMNMIRHPETEAP